MRNLAFIAALFLLASCSQNNQSTADTTSTDSVSSTIDASSAAKIDFEKSTYDFGKITQGEKVAYDFKFTNNGQAPLIIQNATATCGCTVPEVPKDPIAPGQSGVIKVVFNSAGKEGLQDKVVTVTANTIPNQTLLHLVGEIVK